MTGEPPHLSVRFDRALALAAELHRAQRRKGTAVPYLSHLLAVAAIALEHGATEDEAAAALLHDAVEDQGGRPTLERIRAELGDEVAAIVLGCTDADVVPKPPWRARKEAYVARVAGAPLPVRLVSASDKLHNARSLVADYRMAKDALFARFTGGREGTLWYYRALVGAFREGARAPAFDALVDELDRTVSALEQLVAAAK
jgi:(p)ppGpp synthase/HD superfamily hydrolase